MYILTGVRILPVVQHPCWSVFIDVFQDFFEFLDLWFWEVPEFYLAVHPSGVRDKRGHMSSDAFYLGQTLDDVVFPVDIGVDQADDIIEILIVFFFL